MLISATDPSAVAQAAACIRAGALLGLPTETVYGLAADAENAAAVAQIFGRKGRPADHPLIVHVANIAAATHFARDIPAWASVLMQHFWPGPLTLILPRRSHIASAAAGGQDSIGLRCPAHPAALALLNALLLPEPATAPVVHGLAAPSANRFGRVSPTTAAHVTQELGESLWVLDGGPCTVGIESTIIDCTRGQPVLLRPGAISPAQLQAVCGLAVLAQQPEHAGLPAAPKASGTLLSHYAPQTRVRLMSADELCQALSPLHFAPTPSSLRIGIWARASCALPTPVASVHRLMPDQAHAAAHQLFAVLRELDVLQLDEIWVHTPPPDPAWDGVRDRLQRAAFEVKPPINP